jgi:hypothetical protein
MFCLTGLTVLCLSGGALAGGDIGWGVQPATPEFEVFHELDVDAMGNAFVVGYTRGDLVQPATTYTELLVGRYNTEDPAGNWLHQYHNSDQMSWVSDVVADGAGGCFVLGHTPAITSHSPWISPQVVLRHYSAAGSPDWEDTFGSDETEVSQALDRSSANELFVTGHTRGQMGEAHAGGEDFFLRKYNADRTVAWTVQGGTEAREWSYEVCADPDGGAVVVGITEGDYAATNPGQEEGVSFRNKDFFAARYDGAGQLDWKTQLGGINGEGAGDVLVDGNGDTYILGTTDTGIFESTDGQRLAFLSKLGDEGQVVWGRQFEAHGPSDIVLDMDGNVVVFASAYSEQTNDDLLMQWFSPDGDDLGRLQIGSDGADNLYAGDMGPAGRFFAVGYTTGDLAGPAVGSADAFLVRRAIPEPMSLGLLVLGGLGILNRSRRSGRID